MFCIKCGAKLDDGAKFCPQCGTAQGPSAPAPAPTPVIPTGSPDQPHRSSTMRQPASGNGYQQPQAYAAPTRQPVYTEPAPPAPPKKKKKHGGLVVVLILLLVIAGGAFLMRNKISSYALRSFAPPEKYYQHVEKQSITRLSANTADAYDTWVLANNDIDNKTSEGGLEIRLGPAGRDLLMSVVGPTLQQLNPDETLAWLQSLSVEGGRVTKGDLTSMQMKLKLNGTGLVTVNLSADSARDMAYLQVPELKDSFLQMPLSQLQSMSGGSGVMGFVGALGQLLSMDNKQAAESIRSMPDKATVGKLIDKYFNLLLEAAEEVEKEKVTLTVEGVSEEVTALEMTADGEALAKALENVYTEMKKDKDIKEIIVNMSEARDEDGDAAYESFLKELDESLEDLDDVRQNSSGFAMTVYTDAGGEVAGRAFSSDSGSFSMKFPEQGDKFGLELILGEGSSALQLKGKGTKSGDKLTGTLEIETGGSYMGDLILDGLDKEKLKKGELSGAIEIKPSDALTNASGSDSTVSGALRNLSLRLDMDTGKNKGRITLDVLSDGSSILSLTVNINSKSGGSVSAASGQEMEQWSSDLDPSAFLNSLVGSLKSAGVPDAYTSQIPTGD